MMRILIPAACLAISLSASQSQAVAPVRYKVRDSKPMNDASLQIVSLDAATGLGPTAIRKVNTALKSASASFGREAKECSTYAQGHPWGYQLTLEKILLSEKYLSVVFAKSTVCAGSPDIEKEARVFSLPAGNLISPKALFKRIFPTATSVTDVSRNKQLVRLEDDMVETMIIDSNAKSNNYDSRCDFYLKNSSYRIWVDGKNLILFPEFIQPASFCQREYVIQLAD